MGRIGLCVQSGWPVVICDAHRVILSSRLQKESIVRSRVWWSRFMGSVSLLLT